MSFASGVRLVSRSKTCDATVALGAALKKCGSMDVAGAAKPMRRSAAWAAETEARTASAFAQRCVIRCCVIVTSLPLRPVVVLSDVRGSRSSARGIMPPGGHSRRVASRWNAGELRTVSGLQRPSRHGRGHICGLQLYLSRDPLLIGELWRVEPSVPQLLNARAGHPAIRTGSIAAQQGVDCRVPQLTARGIGEIAAPTALIDWLLLRQPLEARGEIGQLVVDIQAHLLEQVGTNVRSLLKQGVAADDERHAFSLIAGGSNLLSRSCEVALTVNALRPAPLAIVEAGENIQRPCAGTGGSGAHCHEILPVHCPQEGAPDARLLNGGCRWFIRSSKTSPSGSCAISLIAGSAEQRHVVPIGETTSPARRFVTRRPRWKHRV